MLGADVDAEDPTTGDGVTEALVAWCARRDLPHLVRLSGRPGGRHVIAVASRPSDRDDWSRLCRDTGKAFRTSVTDRTGMALRLLTAPHREGLLSPVIRCTIVPGMLTESRRPRTSSGPARRRGHRAKARAAGRGGVDTSRSADEWGDTLVHIRRGAGAAEAWAHLDRPGTKAAERGRHWWTRYAWMPAVTTIAAEEGLTEDEAWNVAHAADPATALKRGRRWWREALWARAVDEAATERPRRRWLSTETALTDEQRTEIDAVSTGLRAAAEATMATPDRRTLRSDLATLGAIAGPIVLRAGAASERVLAERAELDPKTVRGSLIRLCEAKVLVQTGDYEGGSKSSASYGIGPAAQEFVKGELDYSPTRCTTPAPKGRANKTRLLRTHLSDRQQFALRNAALAALAAGETLKTSQHPLARLLRSRWAQRRWWASLTPSEQTERRAARQRHLGELSWSDRSAWFDWLAVRDDLAGTIDGAGSSTPTEEQVAKVHQLRPAGWARTFHRGMADPNWRGAAAAHRHAA
ncbi:hypothetical protein [Nocardia salmonicida]|uniref:hypothetical protein n=1 Tax=Nocardia salmonicida TaxID=53431 RepID=UPI00340AC5EE